MNQQSGNEKRSAQAAIIWENRRAELTAMAATVSQAQIAAHYGIAQSTVFKVLKRMGIAARPKVRIGRENGRYIHGKSSTLYRKMIHKSHCNRCGSTKQLLIHHRDGDHYNDAPDNLEVLCSPCHSSHHKTEYWKRKLQ